jgi:hypothetical protein
MKDISRLRLLIKKIISENFETLEKEEVKIEDVNSDEIENILNSCDSAMKLPHFDKVCSDPQASQRLRAVADWSKSIKLTKDGEIIGFYIFSNENPYDFMESVKPLGIKFNIENQELFEELKSKSGVEGVAIGINKEERGRGYGRKLLEYPRILGNDYIWGIQSKGLSDIKIWSKRRDVLATAEAPGGQMFWITVEKF